MFVSEAPCAQAITLIPALPSVPNNLPAIPGVRFIFSPTMATVARSFFGNRIVHITLGTFQCELFIQHLHSQVGVSVADSESRIVFGTGL